MALFNSGINMFNSILKTAVFSLLFACFPSFANPDANFELAVDEPTTASGVSKIFAAEEELPMTTIIMPWRETAPVAIKEQPMQLVTEELVPIDPQVFRRQLQYYNAPLNHSAD